MARDQYDAFLSYSRKDQELVGVLHSELQRYASPWYRPRSLKIFRDVTDLTPAGGLQSGIKSAIERSRWFILIASPDAAKAPWVEQEVKLWLAQRKPERTLIALVDGTIAWAGKDFDWRVTNALPRDACTEAFDEEPLWVDLRSFRSASRRQLRLGDAVAGLAAPIRGTDVSALVGQHIRYRRRTQQIVAATIAVLLLLTAVAFQQRNAAQRQARIAVARQLIAQAEALGRQDPTTAIRLGLAAHALMPSAETESSLLATVSSTSISRRINHPAGQYPYDFAFLPDGKHVGVAHPSRVEIWDLTAPAAPVVSTLAIGGTVTGVAVTPDGQFLATAGTTSLWRLSDLHSPQRIKFSADGQWSSDVAFSPDGLHLAIAETVTISLWRLNDGDHPERQVQFPTGHTDKINDIEFAPDGNSLAVGSTDGTATFWDMAGIASGRPASTTLLGHADWVSVSFSPDGHLLATSSDKDNVIIIWDLAATGAPIRLFMPQELQGYRATFAADRPVLAVRQYTRVQLWDFSDRTKIQASETLIGHSDYLTALAFSPDGTHLLTHDLGGTAIYWGLDTQAGQAPIAHIDSHEKFIMALGFAADGTKLASASADGTVQFYDASRTHVDRLGPTFAVSTEPGPSPAGPLITAVDFSPDGRYAVASGGMSTRPLAMYDLSNPRTPTGPHTPRGDLSYLAVDEPKIPDALGQVYFATARKIAVEVTQTPSMVLWDVSDHEDPRRLSEVNIARWGVPMDLAFHPNGRVLAVVGQDRSLTMWGVDDPAHPTRISAPQAVPKPTSLTHGLHVRFSPDGRLLATAEGASVSLWETSDPAHPRSLAVPLTQASGAIDEVEFSPSGQTLAAGDSEGGVALWDLGTLIDRRDHAVEVGCALAGGGFDQGEWDVFLPGFDFEPTCP